MRRKAYFKNLIREIKDSLGRFVAIIAIVALGSGFLLGILSTTPDMEYSVDSYYKETNMTDIFIKATMGLTERDMEAIRDIDGVRAVMPAYVTDVLMETEDEELLTVRDYGLPMHRQGTDGFVNKLTLLEGRLPQEAGECVVQKPKGSLTAPPVGSRLVISKDNKESGSIGDTYARTVYTVTGVVSNPFYFSNEKEQSPIGDGKVDMIIYTPEESYALEVYTDFYIVLEGSRGLQAFTDEYEDYVEGVVDRIEEISGTQVRLRYEEIRGEADEKLGDARREYLEEKHKAENELADARKELDEGWGELADGKRELSDGENEVASHEEDVAEAERELADGRAELDEAYKTLYANEAEIFTAEQKLAQGQAQLDDGWSQFRKGENQFAEARQQLEEKTEEMTKQEETLLAAEGQLLSTGATEESMGQMKAAMQRFRLILQSGGGDQGQGQQPGAGPEPGGEGEELPQPDKSQSVVGEEGQEAPENPDGNEETGEAQGPSEDSGSGQGTDGIQEPNGGQNPAGAGGAGGGQGSDGAQGPGMQGNADSGQGTEGVQGPSGNADSGQGTGGVQGPSGNADSGQGTGGVQGTSGNADSGQGTGGVQGPSGNADSGQGTGGVQGPSGNADSGQGTDGTQGLGGSQGPREPGNSNSGQVADEIQKTVVPESSGGGQGAGEVRELSGGRETVAPKDSGGGQGPEAVRKTAWKRETDETAQLAWSRKAGGLVYLNDRRGGGTVQGLERAQKPDMSGNSDIGGKTGEVLEASRRQSRQAVELGLESGGAEPQASVGEPSPDEAARAEQTVKAMTVAKAWMESELYLLLADQPEARQLLGDIAALNPPAVVISQEQAQALLGLIDSCESNADVFLKAYGDIQEGKAQLEQGKKQLEEAWDILREQGDKLEQIRKTLQVKQDELDAAANQLAEGRGELEEGWAEYREGEREYQDGAAELEDGKRQLEEARQTLADAWSEVSEGEAELADGEEEYADARTEAEERFAEAEGKIADAQREINDIDQPEWYVFDRGSNVTYASYRMNVEKVADVARVFPVFFFLISALVSLTTMTRMVEEERTQIGTMKALGYGRGAIMAKYMIYCGLATAAGCALGLVCGFKLLPTVLNQAYLSIYDLPPLITRINWTYAGLSCLLQLFCTLSATYGACRMALREKPASLMMPKAPKAGKRIFLEHVGLLWRHMSFSHKATARNLFRYKKHLFMTVTGIAGCTALILVGFGLRDSMQEVAGTQFTDIFQYDMKISLSGESPWGDSQRQTDSAAEGGDREEQNGELAGFLEDRPHLSAVNETVQAFAGEGGEKWTVTLSVPRHPEELSQFVRLYDREKGEEPPFSGDSVVLTEKLADLLEVKEGEEFWLEDADKESHSFTVSGITENYTGGYVYMGPAVYEKSFGKTSGMKDNTVYVKSGLSRTEDQEEESERLLADEQVTGVEFTSQTRNTYERLLGSMNYVVAVLLLCAGGLAVIVLYNLTNININERLRELATLRVLGYHHREVAGYIFREINLLSVMGIGVGLIAGVLLHRYVIITAESLEMMFGRRINVTSYIWASAATLLFTFLVDGLMSVKLRRIRMAESLKTAE